MILELKNVRKHFSRKTAHASEIIRAVDDVSFRMEEGEALGIIGTSGCGKTTLLKLIMGLIPADSGTISLNGAVGVVGQDPYASLCPAMTVEKIIAEPLIFLHRKKNYAACMDRVERVMDFVRLPRTEFGRRYPAQLSGGERQRVGIARALIIEPDILLLDEPTSMLDQEVKAGIASVIGDARRGKLRLNPDADAKKTAFLMVTHDIQLAARICDRILVMNGGRIIEENDAEGILKSPQSPLARDLVNISTDVSAYWKEKYGI